MNGTISISPGRKMEIFIKDQIEDNGLLYLIQISTGRN